MDVSIPPADQPALHVESWSEQGWHSTNEDRLVLAERHLGRRGSTVFALSDGMSGRPLSASMATLACASAIQAFMSRRTCHVHGAFDHANEAVRQAVELTGNFGSGATLCVGELTGSDLELCHAGDTLCYLVHRNTCELLTEPDRSESGRLTNYLGQWYGIAAHYAARTLEPGDAVVVCTDGVWSALSPDEFVEILACPRENAARDLCQAAVPLSGDDASAIVITLKNRS